MRALHHVLAALVLMLLNRSASALQSLRLPYARASSALLRPLPTSSVHFSSARLMASSASASPSALAPPSKKAYVLEYTYVPAILELRVPFREAHLALANALQQQGTILSGGPLLSEASSAAPAKPTGALFLFHCADRSQVEAFVAADPYVANGLVPSHRITEWSVLVGSLFPPPPPSPTSRL